MSSFGPTSFSVIDSELKLSYMIYFFQLILKETNRKTGGYNTSSSVTNPLQE